MLEAEAEYVQQLHILVNNFLRPLRMAASSKKPPITHDDVSSIFLNRYLNGELAWGFLCINCLSFINQFPYFLLLKILFTFKLADKLFL